jgi:hypothetical protein
MRSSLLADKLCRPSRGSVSWYQTRPRELQLEVHLMGPAQISSERWTPQNMA